MKRKANILILLVSGFCFVTNALAQLSPGPLSAVHAHLEGLSNCTKCHDLGNKVSNQKCLDCHSILRDRILQNKGYHVSKEVKGKECVQCHSDHHGRNFEIVRFDPEKFDHSLTGYILQGAHARQECKDCHKSGFIQSKVIREKQFTYLGLSTDCQDCHDDYHQQTLPLNCAACHNFEAFKPAPGFHHSETRFPLKGKHQEVDCKECHPKSIRNGKDFQAFAGISFNSCANCHQDVHQGKLGTRCEDCHTEFSFAAIRDIKGFDHSRTNFPLEGKHRQVDCKDCHKNKLTDPLPHSQCLHCHTDYHQGDFSRKGKTEDCARCHTVQGFQPSTYTLGEHQQSAFPLDGAHLATPCFACHKKTERWLFRNIGEKCIDCHQDIHEPYLQVRYYPERNCQACHKTEAWSTVSFDHSNTSFQLEGRHLEAQCRDCHTMKMPEGNTYLKFTERGVQCLECHSDIHQGQFAENGAVPCEKCHAFENWDAVRFDHQKTRFPLEGRHAEIACERCHKEVISEEITYVQYKMEDIRCAACH